MLTLIIQTDADRAKELARQFTDRGDRAFIVSNSSAFFQLLNKTNPDIVVLDLHCPDAFVNRSIEVITQKHPRTQVLITAQHFDVDRELAAKKSGARVFLRAPFTEVRFERAIKQLTNISSQTQVASKRLQATLPKIGIPVQFKIILPYLILSLILAIGAGYLITQVALDAIEDRFTNNLIEAGRLATAWTVDEENRNLEFLRLVSHIDSLDNAIQNEESETIRELIYGVALNNGAEAIEILDTKGIAIFSMRRIEGGQREDYEYSSQDTIFADQEFVQSVLTSKLDSLGDKYAGQMEIPQGEYLYYSGPIYADGTQLIGAALVGQRLRSLVYDMRESLLGENTTFAHITIYDPTGEPQASTLIGQNNISLPSEMVATISANQLTESHMRIISAAEISYREILGIWEVRHGVDLGFLGVSIAESFLVQPSLTTQIQIMIFASLAVLMIIVIGIYVARLITNPLANVVSAAADVSQGKWDVRIEPKSSDELGYLAHAFNSMTSHLREGEIYRDLLGRTITPQVRDQLRRGISTGNLKLGGQDTIATIIITDIRDFTKISDLADPTTVLSWLDSYYGELAPIVNSYNGFIHEFAGDSLKAVFGVLPVNLSPQKSAYQACVAALDMLDAIAAMNDRRKKNSEPPLITGIGINTGKVAAGGMGSMDRLHYAIIGDTVNVTQRIESLTKILGVTSAIISQDTYDALGEIREEFQLISQGFHSIIGKPDPIEIFRILRPGVKADARQIIRGPFIMDADE